MQCKRFPPAIVCVTTGENRRRAKMTGRLEELAHKMLDAAKRAGADSADALAVDGTSVSIEVRVGALEHAERSEGIDLGLRVLVGQRQACVSVSDASDHSIAVMAERAVAMAKEAPKDDSLGLADPDQLARDWDIAALDLEDPEPEPTPETLQSLALEAEAAALAVQGVAQTQSAGSGASRTRIHLAASNGFSGGYARSSVSTSCVAVAGEGLAMERDYAGEARSHFAELPSATEIGTVLNFWTPS